MFSSTKIAYKASLIFLNCINRHSFFYLKVRARDDWLPFAHVAVAIDTCGHNSEDIYPLMIAKTVRIIISIIILP